MGIGHLRRLDAELTRGAALARLGRCPEAAPILEKGVRELAAIHPESSWRLAWARLEQAECRVQQEPS